MPDVAAAVAAASAAASSSAGSAPSATTSASQGGSAGLSAGAPPFNPSTSDAPGVSGSRGKARGRGRGRGGGASRTVKDKTNGATSSATLASDASLDTPRHARAGRTADRNDNAAPPSSEGGKVNGESGTRHGKGNRDGGGRGRGSGRGRGRGRGGHPNVHASGRQQESQGEGSAEGGTSQDKAPADNRPSRRRQFGGKLTTTGGGSEDAPKDSAKDKEPAAPPAPIEHADLRSRLIYELSHDLYDCAICYSTIAVRQPVWGCTKCSAVLHLKCARQWAESSVQKAEELNAMQENPEIRNRKGTWRCPSCQISKEEVPTRYMCWDGQVENPKYHKGAPAHSCARPCRKSKCEHGCGGGGGICHPGPCPPCPVTITHRCFCGSQELSLRCGQLQSRSSATLPAGASAAAAATGISCGSKCDRLLGCGSHRCQRTCHPGACDKCEIRSDARCYCGGSTKELACGEGTPRESATDEGESWEGRWACSSIIQKETFDCGNTHEYPHGCQPRLPSSKNPCPLSPERVKSCPCGATPATGRTSCQDPIPTCSAICGGVLPCGHSCSSRCHMGDHPPCTAPTSMPCRCGETMTSLPCHQRQSEGEVLCNTTCRALRHCGKHECRRLCCPLYFQAKSSKSNKARRLTPAELELQDPAGLHTCDKGPCGKPLSCGTHSCGLPCHRGPCPPCLEANFSEIICHCGRTVVDPPVPCGATVNCQFPCNRPGPPCGHPKQPHNCHEDADGCPPCVFLTKKRCLCGRAEVENVPCSRSKVSCGNACGNLLECGYHRCSRLCHSGDCGACTSTCGKARSCGHACSERCHAPSACPETQPCTALVTLSCPCGHLLEKRACGASAETASTAARRLKCNDACLLAQRNLRLADALGLNAPAQDGPAEYAPHLVTFYNNNKAYAEELEASFERLLHSARHGFLADAKPSQQPFVLGLAEVWRFNAEIVDASQVSVRRRQDSKVPSPNMAQAWREAVERSAKAALHNGRGGGAGSGGGSALTQLKRPNTGAEAARPFNALLLEGVFGHDAPSLQTLLLEGPLRGIRKVNLTWIGDEDVLVTCPDLGQRPRLVSARSETSAALARSSAANRVVLVAVSDAQGSYSIVRREGAGGGGGASGTSTPVAGRGAWGSFGGGATAAAASSGTLSAPMSRTGSGASSAAPATRLGGWAAVASGATAQQQQLQQAASRTSVWGEARLRAAPPAPPQPVSPAITSSGAPAPQPTAVAAPATHTQPTQQQRPQQAAGAAQQMTQEEPVDDWEALVD